MVWAALAELCLCRRLRLCLNLRLGEKEGAGSAERGSAGLAYSNMSSEEAFMDQYLYMSVGFARYRAETNVALF